MVDEVADIIYRDGFPNYNRDKASFESGLDCSDPSLAVQDARDEVDINTIVRNFGLTGKVPANIERPQLDMFVDVFDYSSAMLAIRRADESFMALDARVRARFDNDAAKFVDFCSDEGNIEELRKLGLAVPKAELVEAPPPEVEVSKA